MSGAEGRLKKENYFAKFYSYLEEYKSVFVVNVDNVGSNQMHQIRQSLRGEAAILMGKNTQVRRAIRNKLGERPELEELLGQVVGNVGFVFTNGDLKDTKEKIVSNRVRAPAKAGALAPDDVVIPAGNTGMEPGKTSFFQALGVPTKISRGTIEITSDVNIIAAGNKVGPSEATLLNMLNISPFTYGMTVKAIYEDGNVFDSAILDISDEDLVAHFVGGIAEITAISLAISYPTVVSVPHLLINGYKDLLAVGLAIEGYSFEQLDKIRDMLENPEAYAAAAPAAASGGAAATESAAAAPAEEEEESDEDMGFGMFD